MNRSSLRRWLPIVFLALFIAFAPAPRSLVRPTERHFRIDAASFAFAPAELSVNPGDTVTIDLVAQDYVHGLSIDGYNHEVSAEPGQPARLTFVADQAGTFYLRCSVPCGPLHPFMLGKLRVGPNWLFYRGIALAFLAVLTAWWRFRP